MNKRRLSVVIAGILIVIAGLGLGKVMLKPPDPVKLVSKSLEQINRAGSFRYAISQHQEVSGNDRVMTQIQGEKEGENVRITGNFIGSDIEMIKINDILYHKDPFNHKWIQFADAFPLEEVFLAELNPLASLQFKELGEVVLNGTEVVNGDKTYVCSMRPSVLHQVMEEFWVDYEYTLYVKKHGGALVKAIITAKSKDKSEPMSLVIEFSDLGQSMKIQAPVE
ncbi:MAG: hypothetical protein LBT32_09640 [Peptococcaceae bacterium]|jgi:hypothetical protein|nr:hypothetical protein [Peptococcaceae bacterium]